MVGLHSSSPALLFSAAAARLPALGTLLHAAGIQPINRRKNKKQKKKPSPFGLRSTQQCEPGAGFQNAWKEGRKYCNTSVKLTGSTVVLLPEKEDLLNGTSEARRQKGFFIAG